MRGITLARVTFYPVRPVHDELRITEHIQARIDLTRQRREHMELPRPWIHCRNHWRGV